MSIYLKYRMHPEGKVCLPKESNIISFHADSEGLSVLAAVDPLKLPCIRYFKLVSLQSVLLVKGSNSNNLGIVNVDNILYYVFETNEENNLTNDTSKVK